MLSLLMNEEELKCRLAEEALSHLHSNIVLGVGSGTTAAVFIELLEQYLGSEDQAELSVVSSSIDTENRLIDAGVAVSNIGQFPEIDVYVDSADAVFLPHNLMIKGGGGCHLREKILANASQQVVIMATQRKTSMHPRDVPIPLEVLPFAARTVVSHLFELGLIPSYRENAGRIGPVLSDNGNVLMDVKLPPEFNVDLDGLLKYMRKLHNDLISIPGILETGIFIDRIKTLLIAKEDGSVETREF